MTGLRLRVRGSGDFWEALTPNSFLSEGAKREGHTLGSIETETVSDEKKCIPLCEVAVWTLYFLIAVVSELGADIMLFPYEPGVEINLYGYYIRRLGPHFLWWFAFYGVLSVIFLGMALVSRRKRK
jgi:hypothetical protein